MLVPGGRIVETSVKFKDVPKNGPKRLLSIMSQRIYLLTSANSTSSILPSSAVFGPIGLLGHARQQTSPRDQSRRCNSKLEYGSAPQNEERTLRSILRMGCSRRDDFYGASVRTLLVLGAWI
jgi:hypothetical protein